MMAGSLHWDWLKGYLGRCYWREFCWSCPSSNCRMVEGSRRRLAPSRMGGLVRLPLRAGLDPSELDRGLGRCSRLAWTWRWNVGPCLLGNGNWDLLVLLLSLLLFLGLMHHRMRGEWWSCLSCNFKINYKHFNVSSIIYM